MRYPEEVYRPEGKGGAAPAAEAELSREERRARRGAKKRTAKKHRAQKVRGFPLSAGATLRMQACGEVGTTRCRSQSRCICGGQSGSVRLYQDVHVVGMLEVFRTITMSGRPACKTVLWPVNTARTLQDSDKRAQSAATAVDGAPLGRKSESAAAAADAEVSAAASCKIAQHMRPEYAVQPCTATQLILCEC